MRERIHQPNLENVESRIDYFRCDWEFKLREHVLNWEAVIFKFEIAVAKDTMEENEALFCSKQSTKDATIGKT